MDNYRLSLKLLLKRFLYLIVAYSFVRLLFVFFQWNSFSEISIMSFIGGVRFDLSVIFYTNILLVIGHLVPGEFKYTDKYQKRLKYLFFSVNIIFISTNFVDFIYYDFTGKRSTFGLITASGMRQEIGGLLPEFAKSYWYILALHVLFAYAFYKFMPRLKFRYSVIAKQTFTYIKQTFVLLAGIVCCIIIGRGGFQPKPLSRVDAIKYARSSNTPIVLNTPFCILKTINKKDELHLFNFYSEEDLLDLYSPVKDFSREPFDKKNIVVIILESFGSENVSFSNPKEGNTPFLDSLILKSLYFKNGFANGRLSIDAVPSVISGIPSIMGESYISSTYAFNDVASLPVLLKKEGYYTSFFHGAFNGSQNFDQYASIAGFDDYFGKNEYPQTSIDEEGGKWGIFDEEFLAYFGKQLSLFKEPFFSSIFTISSHMPFTIPKKHIGKFKKGSTPFCETVGYTDYALQSFFNYAKKQSWYNNTLFIITADHTSMSNNTNRSAVQDYSVPILFFDPSNINMVGIRDKNIQQVDILPSVLNIIHYPNKFISYGNEYESSENLIINRVNDLYHVIIDDYYFVFDGEKIIEYYNFKKDSRLKKNLVDYSSQFKNKQKLERKLKAYIQSFNKNIINNTLVF